MAVTVELLGRMGCLDADKFKLEKLSKVLEETRNEAGLRIHGKRVINIINATQDDTVGTGDLILVLEDGSRLSISITGASTKQVAKCITNPTPKRLGCTHDDIEHIKQIASEARIEYEREMSERFGLERPRRVRTDASKNACIKVASLVAAIFNALPKSERKRIVDELLWLENKPSDYLVIVDKTLLTTEWFHIGDPRIIVTDPRLAPDGIYLAVTENSKIISKIQVKFNNGIMRSDLHTSWNANCVFSELYTLTRINFKYSEESLPRT